MHTTVAPPPSPSQPPARQLPPRQVPPRQLPPRQLRPAPLAVEPIMIEPGATHLEIVAWRDEGIDAQGHDARSAYVERFWLGVVGPSCTWLLRLIAYGFDASPEGFSLPLHDTARALGMGDRMGRSSPFVKAIVRLCQFDLAAPLPEALAVRAKLPWLSRRMIAALPPSLRDEHREWETAAGGMPARPPMMAAPRPDADPDASLAEHHRRAMQLAASVAQTGEDVDGVERALATWGFHPALARHLARWAVASHASGSGGAGTG